MFLSQSRKKAIEELNAAIKKYDKTLKKLNKLVNTLHKHRAKDISDIMRIIEAYLSAIKYIPKKFRASFAGFKSQYAKFKNKIAEFEQEYINTLTVAGGTALGGIVAGVGTTALLPAGAMAVATTFGAASTGTAISALSGAAATNAALAWLGGGALCAGGGGMAAGTAFLALAGPIGISIGALGLITGGALSIISNYNAINKAKESLDEVNQREVALNEVIHKIKAILDRSLACTSQIVAISYDLQKADTSYRNYSIKDKEKLELMNSNLIELSQLVNETV